MVTSVVDDQGLTFPRLMKHVDTGEIHLITEVLSYDDELGGAVSVVVGNCESPKMNELTSMNKFEEFSGSVTLSNKQ